MPTRFAEPNTFELMWRCSQLATQLQRYSGRRVPAEMQEAKHDLAALCVRYETGAKPWCRLPRPISTAWRAMEDCAAAGRPCWRPSEWPKLVSTGSVAPTPKLARDWARIVANLVYGLFVLVFDGTYEEIVSSMPRRKAEEEIEARLIASHCNVFIERRQ